MLRHLFACFYECEGFFLLSDVWNATVSYMKRLLFSLLAFTGVGGLAVAEQKQPNIVLIYGDDLGYGDLGCYNKDSKIPTKHLDSLAAGGMRFTDGHSSSGICTPSRYALLTGRYHWRDFHGIVGPLGGSVFKPERLTLPEMLKEKGYTTGAIGKWHLGWDWKSIRKEGAKRGNSFKNYDWSKKVKGGPLSHGFDSYFGDTVINFPPYGWIENDKLVKAPTEMMDSTKWKKIKEGRWECRPGPMVEGWDPYQNIPVTTQKGVDFIKEKAKSDDPYFLYFAFPSPHAPIIPNDKFDNTSKAGAYGDFVVETDDSVGKLLKAIEDSGEADNTIVIFSADNGSESYAYARDKNFKHWSSFPLRGLKRDVYEGGHRVPFIIKYPGVTKPGSVNHSLVGQIDIIATIADVVGYKFPKEHAAEDSKSMLASLKNASAPVRASLVHNTYKGVYGIREGDWVMISGWGHHNPVPAQWLKDNNYKNGRKDGVKTYLYNLKDDIAQRNNLAEKNPEKVKKLTDLLNGIKEEHGYTGSKQKAK